MKPRNLTAIPANSSSSLHQHWPKLHIHIFQRSGKVWPRFFASLLLLSSILLSPAGSIPAYALDVPVLISPTDSSTITTVDSPPLGIPEFQWTAVPGATKYRLQVSSDIAFTSTLVSTTTSNTTYTHTSSTSFSDGTWYWRVKVETPAGGDYSDIWSFTKQWATPANSPTLISPADSATLDFYDEPAFSWSPVTGAAKYKIRIYSNSGGCLASSDTATTLATTYQPINKLANGTYYWCVLPVDPGSHNGTPSDERSFIAGYNPVLTLLEPNPDAVTYPTFTPTFRWTAVRGAEYYRLQYTTDPSFSSGITQVDTRNTAYTPTSTLPNDQNYYWRVRVYSGNSISEWTTASHYFRKQWYIKPVPLTPTNGYQSQRFPLFSWTPVPGAAYYIVEISLFVNFNPIYETSDHIANTFYSPKNYNGGDLTYYWRVTPYDGNGEKGATSDTASYASYYRNVAPHQVYPLYYYPPDTYSGFPGVTTNPHEDRTVPLPIFIWQRVLIPALDLFAGQVYGDAYRLEVSTDSLFATVNWTVDTENLTAAPTTGNPFTPLSNTDYFWRVCVLFDGFQASPWSQVWKTRFDLSKGLAPTAGAAPTLIRPTIGFEFAEETPLLEWFPMSGASSYDVEISLDANFDTIVDTATVPYPAYVPTQNLAQRSLGALDFGIYYWRVRQTGRLTWSETRRYQISAQSQWRVKRRLGELVNPALIGTDPLGDLKPENAAYDLIDIKAVQNATSWHFGFHIPNGPNSNVTYAIYLDMDGPFGSGAASDALGYDVSASPHLPEYAIYLTPEGGSFAADKIYIYHWLGGSWSTPVTLASVGGRLSQYWDYSDEDGYNGYYVEFLGPNSVIGFDSSINNQAYYISLFSAPVALVDPDGKPEQPEDSAPSDPKIPGKGPIANFAPVLFIDHPWQIGSDPHDLADPNYELTDLHVGQDKDFWYFGFHIPTSMTENVTYALYLDLDHQDGSGATSDAGGYNVTTISAYRPEYALYIMQQGGYFDASNVYLYHWLGSGWSPRASLSSIGGDLGQYSNECNNYVEIRVPNTLIGYQDTTGSYAVSLFTLPVDGSGQPQDSVPSDPNIPGSGPISRFANVTERMNLSMPPNNAGVDPTTYPSILPFFWDYPILAPAAGAIMTAYLDPGFTTEVATYTLTSDTAYYVQISHSWGDDFLGDNTYYWRIRPTYTSAPRYAGAWSQGWRFERQGFVPQNLQTSVTFATPTFSWDMVEGAESYDLQVDNDPGFGSTAININTKQNSYTNTSTLANATYYWRVRVHRNGGVINNWTSAQVFTLALPTPSGLNSEPPGVVGRAPTLCWTPLIVNSPAGDPVLAAWKYRVQVSTEPTFSSTYDTIDTEQSCWTPIKGYKDDQYYWHVAMYDGNAKLGDYSAYQTFTKQYPITTLVSPISGGGIASTPTFVWTPVNGAARYKLEVSLAPNFSSTYDSVTTDNTRYTPTKAYTIPNTYYWRVAIVDGSGNIGPYTDATIILDPYPYHLYLPLIKR